MTEQQNRYVLENITIPTLSYTDILKHSAAIASTDKKGFFDLQPDAIEINFASFTNPGGLAGMSDLFISQGQTSIILSCECEVPKNKLCEHMVRLLMNITDRQTLRVFFDTQLRHHKIRTVAKDYGLENETSPDDYFQLFYSAQTFDIRPKIKELLPVNETSNAYFTTHLLPQQNKLPPKEIGEDGTSKLIVVFGEHKYYKHFIIDLYQASVTKDGLIRNPFLPVNPTEMIWKTNDAHELKFFTCVARFQNNYGAEKSEYDLEGLKALVKNPSQLEVYCHDAGVSEKVAPSSIVPVKLNRKPLDVTLYVNQKEKFFEVSGELSIDDKATALKDLQIKYGYFIKTGDSLYLIDDADLMRVIDFFKQNNHKILIHQSKFEVFRNDIMSKLENKTRIVYSYVRPATQEQLETYDFNKPNEKIIYLSDGDHFVSITPVIRYGDVEVPILSRKQIYATDANGNAFMVSRDTEAEVKMTAALLKQHDDFYDQLHNTDAFYLHKKHFLNEAWFLQAFEEWRHQGMSILGFNELKNNKLNANKPKITIHVTSGINWFETKLEVKFGSQKVSVKNLHKSIRNKNRFVQLDDGTQGILPSHWIDKFAEYFAAAEVVGETLRTPKNSFATVAELYAESELDTAVQQEIYQYQQKFAHFESIEEVKVPGTLQATLRDYQKQGLNWLCFLDEFGFGGCLADDMGLGKTIQIIAFILAQRQKKSNNTNLVVVPTSLVANWQNEVAKFAPTIKLLTLHGAARSKDNKDFDAHEIVLTTYGMLLNDIRFLKDYTFNYVFLDESQHIKNPESQRYKAATLLRARNRIVLTGTPIENNTFDIYGQLSFACPGLLGNKQHFKDIYSTPIDKFGNSKRAKELQKKISPFILRRTKRQVAQELPDKTEMVIYCEMGTEQRRVYEAIQEEVREYLEPKQPGDLPKETMFILKALTRLRQVCNSPALLQDEALYGNSSAKIEALMEQIESKAPNHKILVFSQFVGMLDLIKKQLERKNIRFAYLTGQTTNRAAVIDSFQNDSDIRVFLISLKAGGTGLNLTEADYVYLVDPWWNPAVENQAIDRSHRIGQNKNVVAVRLICPNTVEEKILLLQGGKRDLANDLIKTDAAILKALSKNDLMSLLGKPNQASPNDKA
jgi:superfamily II DNA or RNA helicase